MHSSILRCLKEKDDTTRYDAVHRCSVSIFYSDHLLYKDQSTPYASYRSQQGH